MTHSSTLSGVIVHHSRFVFSLFFSQSPLSYLYVLCVSLLSSSSKAKYLSEKKTDDQTREVAPSKIPVSLGLVSRNSHSSNQQQQQQQVAINVKGSNNHSVPSSSLGPMTVSAGFNKDFRNLKSNNFVDKRIPSLEVRPLLICVA
jgi:hypothetical protein